MSVRFNEGKKKLIMFDIAVVIHGEKLIILAMFSYFHMKYVTRRKSIESNILFKDHLISYY